MVRIEHEQAGPNRLRATVSAQGKMEVTITTRTVTFFGGDSITVGSEKICTIITTGDGVERRHTRRAYFLTSVEHTLSKTDFESPGSLGGLRFVKYFELEHQRSLVVKYIVTDMMVDITNGA